MKSLAVALAVREAAAARPRRARRLRGALSRWLSKLVTADAAAARIPDGAVVTVSSSSGLGCPDKVLAAIGARFDREGHPREPDHAPPDRRGRHVRDQGRRPHRQGGPARHDHRRLLPERALVAADARDLADDRRGRGRGLQRALGHPVRHAPRRRGAPAGRADPGRARHLRRPDPRGLRDERAGRRRADRRAGSSSAARPGSTSRTSCPNVAILRATTADERGNLTYEHEGAYLGGLDQAIAVRNHGGLVIAQVKRMTAAGSLRPHDVRVPGHLVDLVVVDPEQQQTTETPYDPAISGEIMRPWSSFTLAEHGVEKVVARRAAMELQRRPDRQPRLRHLAPMVPRILLEEGHGAGRDLGDRAGRGRGHAADRLRLRLRLERRRLHALAEPVHLFPGRRLRRVVPVVPRDRRGGQRQRLQARQEALPDGGLRRVRRHHGACEEDRLRRAVRGRGASSS